MENIFESSNGEDLFGDPPGSLSWALRYHGLGWSIFPLKPHTKKPHPQLLPKKKDYPELFPDVSAEDAEKPTWKPYQVEQASEDQIREWWSADPDAGIAVVLGKVSGGLVAFDFDGDGADQLAKDNDLHLPPTAISKTGGGGHHFLYRSPVQLATMTTLLEGDNCHIELRAEGSYVVLPPSIHPMGTAYEWATPPEEIVELPDDIRERVQAHRQAKGRESAYYAQKLQAKITVGERNQFTTEYAGRLLARGLPEEEVKIVLLALRDRFFDGKETTGFSEDELEKVVASIGGRQAAKEIEARREIAQAAPTATAEFLAQAEDYLLQALPDTGYLRDFYGWVYPSTDAPTHFHVFAGLATVGVILERRVRIPFGALSIWPNIYLCLIAPSSRYHKTSCLVPAERLLGRFTTPNMKPKANEEQSDPKPLSLLLPQQSSPEALFDSLEEQRAGVIAWDELGEALARFGRSYMAGFMEFLTQIYDSPETPIRRRLRKQNIIIRQPCISIITASTPEWLTENLTESQAGGGFLARWLLIPATEKARFIAWPKELQSGGVDVGLSNQLRDLQEQFPAGEVASVGISRVQASYETWAAELEAAIPKGRSEVLRAAFLTRLGPLTLKLAMLLHFSESAEMTLTTEALDRAVHIGKFLMRYIDHLVTEELAFTPTEKWRQKALRAIRDAGADGIRQRDLYRGVLQGLEKRPREDLIKALEEEELVWRGKRDTNAPGPAPLVIIAAEYLDTEKPS